MKKVFLTLVLVLIAGTVSVQAKLISETDLSYGPSELQSLDVWWDDLNQNAPIVFLVHGGGWTSGDKRAYSNQDIAELITKKGCVLVSPNYRLLGSSDDPGYFEVIQDVWYALGWMINHADRFQADNSRILVGGSSAGSYLSACLAYGNNRDWLEGTPYEGNENIIQSGIRGWYGDSNPVDFAQVANSGNNEKLKAFSSLFVPLEQLDKGEPEAYLSNGDNDRLTPFSGVEAFMKKCKKLGIDCKVLIIPGGHMVGTRILFNEYEELQPKFKEFLNEADYEKYRQLARQNLLDFIDHTVLIK